MKRTITAVLCLLLVLCLALPSVCAANGWDDSIWRVVDCSEELTENDVTQLDGIACNIVTLYGIDAAAWGITEKELEGTSLEDAAPEIYTGYGYGEDASGVLLLYNTDTRRKEIFAFGQAQLYFTDEVNARICDTIAVYADEYGLYGVFEAYFMQVMATLQEHVADGSLRPLSAELWAEPIPEQGESDTTATEEEPPILFFDEPGGEEVPAEEVPEAEPIPEVGTEPSAYDVIAPFLNGNADPAAEEPAFVKPDLPDWYPDDLSDFDFFSDPAASRVVDNAGIFTASEEAEMAKLIAKYSAAAGRDIVVYTDVSSYGLGEDVLAADFYDFNGYGIGPEREGVCLFINMDPYDRCWWCCCTGPETMADYTEGVSDKLDDRLYGYMADGEYGEGVIKWIKDMGSFLKTGRVPKTAVGWLWTAILSLGSGSLFGGIATGKASSAMITKKKVYDANDYLVPNSLGVTPAGDYLINVTSTRTKIASATRSSGSGGSHYSGSYHGSSGSFHSGSGRHF